MELGKLYLALIILFFLSGCATVVTEAELSKAQFEPLQENYKLAIKSYMSSKLKDPYSATYRFGKPQCGFSQDGLVHGGKKHFGHIIPTFINAKNSYGGFTGEKARYFFFADGGIGDVTGSLGFMADFVPCPNFVKATHKASNTELKPLVNELKAMEQSSGSKSFNLVKKKCVINGVPVTNTYINQLKIAYKEAGYSDEASEIYIKSAFPHCLIDD